MQYIEATYSYPLVAISIAVAILSSFVSIEFANVALKSDKKGHLRKWLIISSLALGLGIWTMHFIGMVAFKLPIPVQYEITYTALSLLVAITASFFGFVIAHIRHNAWYAILGGTIMGAGIAGMHYLGMHAMHLAADRHYDILLVTLSVFIAITVSSVALWLIISIKTKNITKTILMKTLVACIMGIAISSMHYTGMAAMNLTLNENIVMDMHRFMIEDGLTATQLSLAAILLILFPMYLSRYENRYSEELVTELELIRTSEARLRSLIENVPDEFYTYDIKGKIIDVNDTACNKLGYTHDELVSGTIFDFEICPIAKQLINTVWPSLEAGTSYTVSADHICKDGSTYPVEVSMACIVDGDKRFVFALARDVTETENLKAHLSKLAMTDELTDLFNRRAFMSSLDKGLSRAKRNNEDLSVLMIDIDLFKKINDSYGHHVGDMALQHFSQEAKNAVRNEDTIGRLGGEEFAVLLPNTGINEAGDLAERLRKSIEDTFIEHDGSKISFTVSIGVAALEDKNMPPTILINNADHALYNAKESGRNRIILYSA